ncbi:MAG: HAMP domain-containing protein, partial [Gammaproteobacteria bacterium]|nr:HAMP domain-containing protein [Gammaproteobacteria bacterium]
MRIGRPRTLLGLVLVALALVTLPLLIAIGNAALKLGQLAAESEAVAGESATTSVENQRVQSLLTNLERNARQYLVLREEELLALYDSDQAALKESVRVLLSMPQDPAVVAQLQQLEKSAEDMRAVLARNAPSEQALEIVVNGFRAMNDAARNISQGMRMARNMQLNALQDSTREAQQALMWQSAALIPGTIVLILFFLVLVGRPLRQVDRAIRELGSGDFSHSIAVTGPRDIATLGRQLEWLRHRLKESTEEKNKFLRHMSH